MVRKHTKVYFILVIVLLVFMLLFQTFYKPKLLTINGTFTGIDAYTTHLTFDERTSNYYTYFFSTQSDSSDSNNHGTFKKLSKDIYLLQGGAYDQHLIRLYDDYMEIIDLEIESSIQKYEKTSEVPVYM